MKISRRLLVLRFDTKEMFQTYAGFVTNNMALTNNQASFVAENGEAKMLILVQELNVSSYQSQAYKYADLDVFLQWK